MKNIYTVSPSPYLQPYNFSDDDTESYRAVEMKVMNQKD